MRSLTRAPVIKMLVVSAEDIVKRFGDKVVRKGVSLEAGDSDLHGLLSHTRAIFHRIK